MMNVRPLTATMVESVAMKKLTFILVTTKPLTMPTPGPGQNAEQGCRGNAQVLGQGEDHARQRQGGADPEVDSPGDHEDGQADRDNPVDRELRCHLGDVAFGGEEGDEENRVGEREPEEDKGAVFDEPLKELPPSFGLPSCGPPGWLFDRPIRLSIDLPALDFRPCKTSCVRGRFVSKGRCS